LVIGISKYGVVQQLSWQVFIQKSDKNISITKYYRYNNLSLYLQ